MHATTARGTDAERTDAAPVVVELEAVDVGALLVLLDVPVGLEVVLLELLVTEIDTPEEVVTGTSDPDADVLVTSVADTDSEADDSVVESLQKNSLENRCNSAVKSRVLTRDYPGGPPWQRRQLRGE